MTPSPPIPGLRWQPIAIVDGHPAGGRPWPLQVLAVLRRIGLAMSLCLAIPAWSQVALKVGVYNFAPLVFAPQDGPPQGLFVDMLAHVAQKENWRLDYVAGSWQQSLARLERGEIDLLLCIGPSAERRQRFDFMRQHLFLDWGLVFQPKGRGIASLFDLRGKRVGVLKASIYTTAFRQLLEQFEIQVQLVEKAEYDEIFQAIERGELDAGIHANVAGAALEKRFDVERTAIVFAPTQLSIATLRGTHQAVMARLDEHLTRLYADPSSYYHERYRHWMGFATRHEVLPTWIVWALGALVGAAVLLFAHSRLLARQVARRTADLESARAYLDQIVSSAPVGIATHDADGRCLTVNQQAADIVGGTVTEMHAQNFRDNERWRRTGLLDKAELTLSSGQTTRLESHWGQAAGRDVWMHSTFARFVVDGHAHLVHIAADVSERKAAEAELLRAHEDIQRINRTLEARVKERTEQLEHANSQLERTAWNLARSNKELEEFAYVASHDLQEPLRMVVGFVQLLEKRLDGRLEGETREFMNYAVDGSLRMQGLIRDILAYSRVNAGGRVSAEVDGAQVLGDALALLDDAIHRTGAQLEVGAMPRLRGDATQLTQLFQNLIGNALKFCKQRAPRVAVTARDDGTHWRISITDNGIGIEPQYADRIFGIFQRLHARDEYPGTGIGLAVCKRIVLRHRGEIGVHAAEGGGSVFWFTLAKSEAPA